MVVSDNLQNKFDSSYEKKIDSEEWRKKLKMHLLSLWISKEFIKDVLEKAFVWYSIEEIINPETDNVILNEYWKMIWINNRIWDIIRWVADDYGKEEVA